MIVGTIVSIRLFRLLGLLALIALGCTGAVALAGEATAHSGKLDGLVVGVDYVVPPFVAGAKVRTPEAIDTTLAEQVAERLHVKLATIPADRADLGKTVEVGGANMVLAAVPGAAAASASTVTIPTGYTVAPMAILRSDTDIKTWEQLKGRTVCLSQGSRYIGMVAARYGAIEKIFGAPADSLLALRTGRCDATVHDDAMLNELLKFPEWKKYSAQLSAGPRVSLAFVVPVADAATVSLVEQMARQWKASRYLAALTKTRARDIAFEVYLDQNVPDCH